jgi:hypothetical protein
MALGAVLFAFLGAPLYERWSTGKNDFLQLYAGARLVGTPELYDIEASKRIHLELTGTWYPSVYWTRLPWYALALSPLGGMPYQTAYRVWVAFNIVVVGAWLLLYSSLWEEFPIFVALSLPLLVNFTNGQDAGLAAALAGFAVLLICRDLEFAAGLLLALCSIKFHLFVLLPVAFIVHQRWRVIHGALAGAAILVSLSILAASWQWPQRFFAVVSNPELHPHPERMPTLYGLLYMLGVHSRAVEIALAAGVALWVAWLARRWGVEVSVGLALVGGVLVCHHAYVADTVVVLLALALFAMNGAPKPLLGATMVTVLPVTALAILGDPPGNALMHAALFAILIAASATKAADDRRPV